MNIVDTSCSDTVGGRPCVGVRPSHESESLRVIVEEAGPGQAQAQDSRGSARDSDTVDCRYEWRD